MVAKIRLEAEDATGPGFQSLNRSATDSQRALDGVARSFEDVSDTSSAAQESMQDQSSVIASLQREFDDLESELKKLEAAHREAAAAGAQQAASLDRTGDEAAQSADQVRRLDAALDKASSSGGSFVESMAKLWAMKEVLTKLAQGANALAEQGNPAFVELQEKAQGLFDQLVKLTELEEVQIFIKTVADGFGEAADFVARNADNLDGLIKRYKNLVEVAYSYMEAVGLVAEGTTAELQRMKALEAEESKRWAAKLEQQKAEVQAKKQAADLQKIEDDLAKTRAAAADAEQVKKVTTATELQKMQEAELARVKELQKAGKLTAEEGEAASRKLQMLEARKTELAKEADAAVMKSTEESKKKSEEAAKAEIEWKARTAEEARKVEAEKLKGFEEYVQKLKDALNAAQEGKGGINLETLGGGAASRQKAARHLIEQNVNNAAASVDQDFGSKYERGSDGRFKQEGVQALYAKELAMAKRQADRETKQDIRSGKADDKLNEIQTDFAKGYIETAGAEKNLSRNSIVAMKAAVEETMKRKQEVEQLSMDVERMQELISGMGSNDRRRNQRRG